MSRIRNSDSFLLAFRRIQADYGKLFQPRLAEIRAKYANVGLDKLPSEVDESLEFHARSYIINALLAALNWRLDSTPESSLPNLVPESPVRSEYSGHIRFLDYLGVEQATDRPLLIVETKRPREALPRIAKAGESLSGVSIPLSAREEAPSVIVRGLNGEPLLGEWNDWLDTLRDYVLSVYKRSGEVPARVVSTNGNWLVIFLDPADSFLSGGTRSVSQIVVFEDQADIEGRHKEVFRHLEYFTVARAIPGLTPSQLSFYISGANVETIFHGLRLRYIEQPTIFLGPSPVVKVAPIILMLTRNGAWLRVEDPPRDYEIPHDSSKLIDHLEQVRSTAEGLLANVCQSLQFHFDPAPLSRHYESVDDFGVMPGVMELGRDEFIIMTGNETHYVLPDSSVPNCPYHDWGQCKNAGVPSHDGALVTRTVNPRSFFSSAELHHCAHRDVVAAKGTPIGARNKERTGSRSGGEGAAFCEIWRFETHLCCRTCAFETVCTKAEVFQLPCRRPESGSQVHLSGSSC